MNITIFHDPNVEASRRLLASLGVAIPEGDDVIVTVGSDTVRIVAGQENCLGVCRSMQGYPAAVVTVDNKQYVLNMPTTWAEVTAWAENPAPAVEKPTTLSKYAFSQRFKSDEMIGILALRNSDPTVGLFLQLMDYAQEIDLEDTNIKSGIAYLVTLGKLTQDRATEILTA